MKLLAVLAVVTVLSLGCGRGDEVDPNPGQGEDVPGDVTEDKGDGH